MQSKPNQHQHQHHKSVFIRFSSGRFRSILFNPIQSNPTRLNQPNSIQFNPIESNPTQLIDPCYPFQPSARPSIIQFTPSLIHKLISSQGKQSLVNGGWTGRAPSGDCKPLQARYLSTSIQSGIHPSIHPSHPIPSHPIPSMRSLPSRGCREEEDIKNSFRLGCVPLVRPSTSKTRPACHRRERETAPIEQVNKRRCKSRSTLCHACFLRAGHGDIHNIIIVINSTSGTRSMLVTTAAAAIAPD